MKTWIKLMLVGATCAVGGFLSGMSLPSADAEDDDETCAQVARKLAGTVDKCQEQFNEVNRQAIELGKITKEAIEQRDQARMKCALQFTQEAAVEEGAQREVEPESNKQ